ncbi:uncharacterized protein EI90DRAFT_3091853 [Cantharellus anzutake]|uniref:uncharacterized protein n=1 Tax=Cantharellus anzutake TaxID=1750568 RepID=UPI0019086851|nr:uncharacterized protein EI90DRAFT_3091853 [Cantharellus anzutake]KAF8313501.1 hypothetical protein EI90DRAFT_3091853 [Cantharellus anzutake]
MVNINMLVVVLVLCLASLSFSSQHQAAVDFPGDLSRSISEQLDPNNTLAVVEGAFPFISTNTSGVRIPAGWSFSIGFHPFLSVDDGFSVQFGAAIRSEDGTISELPAWLDFSNNSLTFSGIAPVKSGPEKVFDYQSPRTVDSLQILVYCSLRSDGDEPVQSASGSFLLIITPHVLTVENNIVDVVSTSRDHVVRNMENLLFPTMTIDGHPATGLSSIHVDMEIQNQAWLNWDSATFLLSGVVPDRFLNGSMFSVPARLSYGSASYPFLVRFEVNPFPFTAFDHPNIPIEPRTPFNASLSTFLRDPLQYQYSLPQSLNPRWLSLDVETHSLLGIPPDFARGSSSTPITIIGRGIDSGLTSTVSLNLVCDLHAKASNSSKHIKWSTIIPVMLTFIISVAIFVGTIVKRSVSIKHPSIVTAKSDKHFSSTRSTQRLSGTSSDRGEDLVFDASVPYVGAAPGELLTEEAASVGVRLVTAHQSSDRSLDDGPSPHLVCEPVSAHSPSSLGQFNDSRLTHTPDSTSSWDRESEWLENKRFASWSAFWRRADLAPGPSGIV